MDFAKQAQQAAAQLHNLQEEIAKIREEFAQAERQTPSAPTEASPKSGADNMLTFDPTSYARLTQIEVELLRMNANLTHISGLMLHNAHATDAPQAPTAPSAE
jgi:hypothetical protein